MRALVSSILLCFLLGMNPQIVKADDGIDKLGRGFTNLLTFWGEIPRGMEIAAHEKGIIEGSVTGFIRGGGKALGRLAVGLYEIVTFPLPLPKNYEPVLQPEFVFNDYGTPDALR